VAEDFVVASGKNKKKEGDLRCHLEELGLAGEAVGAEALVEARAEVGEGAGLVGVTRMPGHGLAMVCHMGIPMGDTDLVIHTMAMAQGIPTGN
jgi:hypothetical protein